MARGWESKSVEAQQEAATSASVAGAAMSPEEAERRRHQAALQLARTRAAADLQTAVAPAHRRMLEQTIADLDRLLDPSRSA
jgi:hypothetical protein